MVGFQTQIVPQLRDHHHSGLCSTTAVSENDCGSITREIHPLEPQRHRHSMLAPKVCAPRVTRCSLGHVI